MGKSTKKEITDIIKSSEPIDYDKLRLDVLKSLVESRNIDCKQTKEEMVKNFTSTNLLPYLGLVGFLEIISVCLLVYPRTILFGAVGVTSVMSAAAVIHLSYMGGVGVFVPIVIGVLSWLVYYLRK